MFRRLLSLKQRANKTLPLLFKKQQFFHNKSISTTFFASQSDSFYPNGWQKLLFAAVAGIYICNFDTTSNNCGIVGVVGSPDARSFLLEGVAILRNRGYDSAGIATLHDGNLEITKYASRGSTADSIELLAENSLHHTGSSIGIAHTRWATHGGKTDENAHPHTDYKNRIALVHNGTINNSTELKNELIKYGIKMKSETDTEVVAQLIGFYMDQGLAVREATAKALSRCDGTWGIAIIEKGNPHSIIVACNGSPMVIGLGKGNTFVASEPTAFNRFTKQFIPLKDGEIGVVHADSTSLDLSRVEVAPEQNILLSPAPYPHWSIRECLEQPEAIARALSFGGRMSEDRVYLGGLERQKERMTEIRNLILTGCGTSLNAAMYGAKLMREYQSFDTVQTIDSAEVRRYDLPSKFSGVLALSQSGETKDVHRAVVTATNLGVPTISVVNAVGSLIARTTGLGVYLNAGREMAVASTKSFTSQVTVLALLTCWFRQLREDEPASKPLSEKKQLLEALQRLPICAGITLRSREKCKEIALQLLKKEHLFILGKGYAEPIAYEGALKLKEMAYIHAEGYSGGALKHGPFALIDAENGMFGRTPVICIILDDEHSSMMKIAAEEVKARGAELIIITDNPKLVENIDSCPIVIPSNGPLTALLAVIPLQLIAYELAILKNINPDVPRNLAKAVTVD